MLPIDAIVVADIHQHDAVSLDQEFEGDAVGQIDGHRMQPRQLAAQGMQPQGWMMRIGFQQLQRLQVDDRKSGWRLSQREARRT